MAATIIDSRERRRRSDAERRALAERHAAALPLINRVGPEERWAILAFVVWPPEHVLARQLERIAGEA